MIKQYIIALLVMLCLSWTSIGAQSKQDIPEIGEVGAALMPDDIEPVKGVPFDMPQFKRPVFPDVTINISERGARSNVLVTSIINQAIVDVNKKGGGTVLVPPGRWKSGRIMLKSNVNLHIAEGAEIEFSGDIEDYLPAVFTRHEGIELFGAGAFIYADGENNIAVTGKGTITGPALDSEVRKRTNTAAVVEIDVPATMPLNERLFDGMEGRDFQPPRTIAPINCTNVFIEGITMNRSALWNVVPTYCENVIIRGITVNSLEIPRGDGIDIESSKNVLIEYCTLNTHDDCFTLKSGRGEEGVHIGRPTANVVIRHSLATNGPGGITCGSETAGNIKNIYAHDCVFKGTMTGILFKTRRPRGGGTENVLYERIRMIDVKDAFKWELLGSKRWVGELADRMPLRAINSLTPVVRNIHVRDFIVESSDRMITAICIPEVPLRNVLIENGTVHCKQIIPRLNDVEGFTLSNITIHSQDNKINILDGRDVLFRKVKFITPEGEVIANIEGEQSKGVLFEEVYPNVRQERFPDGTLIPAWFYQSKEADINAFGKKYCITDYGVVNDSTIVQTEKIQAVIDSAEKNGGGVVIIPKGTFLSGSLFFKPKTHLYLEEKATLKGSDDISDFAVVDTRMEGQSLKYFAALLNADEVDGFTVSGKGTINGNGMRYWKSFWLRREVNPKCTNMDELRPRLLYVSNSKNVQISGVRLINSPFWTTHFYKCEQLRLLNLHITSPTSPVHAPSTDGVDIDVCTNVLIKNCYISVDDDGIALKGGKGPWADRDPNNGMNSNILIEDCTFGYCHGALTCGSEGIHNRNIVLRRSKIDKAENLLRLKMRPDTPQRYEYILVEDIQGSAKNFIQIRPWTQFFNLEDRKDVPLSYADNIAMRNIELECNRFFVVEKSEQYRLSNFHFEDLRIKAKNGKYDVNIIDGLSVKNVIINE